MLSSACGATVYIDEIDKANPGLPTRIVPNIHVIGNHRDIAWIPPAEPNQPSMSAARFPPRSAMVSERLP